MRNHDQKLLEGDVVDPPDDSEVERLRADLRRAIGERDTLRAENVRLRQRVNQIDGPAAHLRQTLEPLYQALQAMFGDIEVIDPQPAGEAKAAAQPSPAAPSAPQRSEVWESWKQRLQGAPAKIIDALLLHREASVEQLVVLTQISRRTTIYDAIHRMNKAGIIDKNGGKFSLKQL